MSFRDFRIHIGGSDIPVRSVWAWVLEILHHLQTGEKSSVQAGISSKHLSSHEPSGNPEIRTTGLKYLSAAYSRISVILSGKQ